MARKTIYIPDELEEEYKILQANGKINLSKLAQQAIEKAVASKDLTGDQNKLFKIRWPTLGEHAVGANKIFLALHEERLNVPAKVETKEGLESEVGLVLAKMIESPKVYDLLFIDRLISDYEYRRNAITAGMVRSSNLWPLSLLFYIPKGIEEITSFSYNQWIIKQQDNKALLVGECPFSSDAEVTNLIQKILASNGVTGSKLFDEANPIANAILPGGIRLTAIMSPDPFGKLRSTLSIRFPESIRFPPKDSGIAWLSGSDQLPTGIIKFLNAAVQARLNILVAGETASGKTQLLKFLFGLLPESNVVALIEKEPELGLFIGQPGFPSAVIPLTPISSTQPENAFKKSQVSELLIASEQYNPDTIILGELRPSEITSQVRGSISAQRGIMATLQEQWVNKALQKSTSLCDIDLICFTRKLGKRFVDIRAISYENKTSQMIQVYSWFTAPDMNVRYKLETTFSKLPSVFYDKLSPYLGDELPSV
jgi:type IV secretory pathway ATPase VirB11/archaellum biosynthesis ATPase